MRDANLGILRGQLDITNLHTHGDYFPVIELTLTASQRNQLQRGRSGSDLTVPVSIHETTEVGDGPDVPKVVCLILANLRTHHFCRNFITYFGRTAGVDHLECVGWSPW